MGNYVSYQLVNQSFCIRKHYRRRLQNHNRERKPIFIHNYQFVLEHRRIIFYYLRSNRKLRFFEEYSIEFVRDLTSGGSQAQVLKYVRQQHGCRRNSARTNERANVIYQSPVYCHFIPIFIQLILMFSSNSKSIFKSPRIYYRWWYVPLAETEREDDYGSREILWFTSKYNSTF